MPVTPETLDGGRQEWRVTKGYLEYTNGGGAGLSSRRAGSTYCKEKNVLISFLFLSFPPSSWEWHSCNEKYRTDLEDLLILKPPELPCYQLSGSDVISFVF